MKIMKYFSKKSVRSISLGILALGFAALLAPAFAGDAPAKDAKADSKAVPSAYPLDTCIVSGKKLGTMGAPIVKQIDGREVQFCCNGCPAAFEKDKATFMKKMDDAIIAQQKKNYPTDVCVISGDKLGGEMGKPVDVVVNNRYMQLCCKDCMADFQKDPAKYFAKLDEAVIAKQGPTYPLDTCVVSGEKLTEMGKPIDYVSNGRLVRFCCAKCIDT